MESPTPAVNAAEAAPLSTVPTLGLLASRLRARGDDDGRQVIEGVAVYERAQAEVHEPGFTCRADTRVHGAGDLHGREWEEDELKGKKIVRMLQVLKVSAERRTETGGHPDDAVGRTKERFSSLFAVRRATVQEYTPSNMCAVL